MKAQRGLLLGTLVTLACTVAAHAQVSTEAANSQVPTPAPLSTKGIVTATGNRSFAIRETGGGVLHVVETPQTRVTGLRTTFVQIAVSDIVNVEGTGPNAARVVAARTIHVLFAAEGTERAHAKPANWLWQVIRNGGVTVDLP